MSEFPCQNRSCSSYGSPHPNCQCYSGMADGGDAKPFCSETRKHKEGCQYFADGGEPTWDETQEVKAAPPPDDDSAGGPPTWKDTKEGAPTWDQTSSVEPEWQDTKSKYETTAQKVATGLEGAAQGFAGPLATLAEKGLSKLGVPELSDEDIKGRQEANPGIHAASELAGLGAGLVTGVGEAALLGKAATGLAKAAKIGEGIEALEKAHKAAAVAAKVGSAALQGVMQTVGIQLGDNISKALIGQGDPNEGVAATLADGLGTASLIGGVTGALGKLTSEGLSALADGKKGSYIHGWLSGIGESAKGVKPDQSYARYLNPDAYDTGAKWWKYRIVLPGLAGTAQAGDDVWEGIKSGDVIGGLEEAVKDVAKGALWTGAAHGISKVAAPVLLKALSTYEGNPRAIFQAVDYANKANSGLQKMTSAVENIFKLGGQQATDKYDFENQKLKLDKFIEDGGINQEMDEAIHEQQQAPTVPGYAEGGEVKKGKEPEQKANLLSNDNGLAQSLPEQNTLLNAARARISNYLTGLRPQKNQPKLAFDNEPDQSQKKKTYNKALDIAVNPLSVLKHLNNGTLEPEHLQHLNGLYPEVNQTLQKKLTEKIIQSQLSGKKPSYAVRQGLSMMLGTPLMGEMLPQHIQAAQATFKLAGQSNAGPQAQGIAPKSKTSKLSKSNQAYLTGTQALTGRQQRQS